MFPNPHFFHWYVPIAENEPTYIPIPIQPGPNRPGSSLLRLLQSRKQPGHCPNPAGWQRSAHRGGGYAPNRALPSMPALHPSLTVHELCQPLPYTGPGLSQKVPGSWWHMFLLRKAYSPNTLPHAHVPLQTAEREYVPRTRHISPHLLFPQIPQSR